MKLPRHAVAASLLATALFTAGLAAAQSYPSRPVRIIVAFPAGGGTDITARVVAGKLTSMWGQQVVVENRAGASGIIGTELAARSAPDGYTLFMGTMGNLTVNKHLFPKMTVDPIKDFAPITNVVAVHFVMVAKVWAVEPVIYATVVAVLLGYRLVVRSRQPGNRANPVTGRRPARAIG